jgi:hypothetical protein
MISHAPVLTNVRVPWRLCHYWSGFAMLGQSCTAGDASGDKFL